MWLCHLDGMAPVAVHHVNDGSVCVACLKYSNIAVYVVRPQPPQPLPISLPSTAQILNITKVELCFIASVNNPVSEEDSKDPLIYYIIEPRWGWGTGPTLLACHLSLVSPAYHRAFTQLVLQICLSWFSIPVITTGNWNHVRPRISM